jgi:hypothetical protein
MEGIIIQRGFFENIRSLNSIFHFTSFGSSLPKNEAITANSSLGFYK